MTDNVIVSNAFAGNLSETEREELLISRLQQGQQSALRSLYELHHKRVYALCVRLSGDAEIAEDITQEVFVQLWQKIGNFKGQSKFTTWLHAVTSNIAISHMRKQKSWWRSWFNKEQQNSTDLAEMAVTDEQSDHSLSRSGLDKHIQRLPEQARIVFVLFAVEGWRHEEISKELGIAVGSSKSQFHRAKQLLKEAIENE